MVIERSGDLLAVARLWPADHLDSDAVLLGPGYRDRRDAGLDLEAEIGEYRHGDGLAPSAGGEPVPAAMGQTGDRVRVCATSPAVHATHTAQIPIRPDTRCARADFRIPASAVAEPAPAATMTWPWDGVSNPLPSTRSGVALVTVAWVSQVHAVGTVQVGEVIGERAGGCRRDLISGPSRVTDLPAWAAFEARVRGRSVRRRR